MDKLKLLIVDDDIDLSHMLSAYFRGQNYDVRSAVWGQEALTISREEPVHLIMLDIRLPDMDGYEVYHQLRQNRHTQDIPIIFLSERRHRVEVLHGLELGVVDYIPKPFDVQELGLRVRNALQRVTQPTLINPVTELPEAQLLEERLSELVHSEQPWALLGITVDGLGRMREQLGFVAADELMRAIALMTKSALRVLGNESDVVAHYSPEALVVVTTVDRVRRIQSRIETLVRQSLMYFYAPQESFTVYETGYLNIETFILQRESYQDVRELKEKLAELLTSFPPPGTHD